MNIERVDFLHQDNLTQDRQSEIPKTFSQDASDTIIAVGITTAVVKQQQAITAAHGFHSCLEMRQKTSRHFLLRQNATNGSPIKYHALIARR